MTSDKQKSSLALLQEQRSHILIVLSNPEDGCEVDFREWYRGAYRQSVLTAGVLSARHYERHEVDITRGRHAPLPFHYLGLYELSLDGAEAAQGLIERVATLHRENAAARAPATWLYYPVSERVGRSPAAPPSMLTVAFANGLAGREAEFREWYATRHIRHALNVSPLVSGQCFERTLFQEPGALPATFNTIALYEQVGSPQDILDSFSRLPQGALRFPMLDVAPSRFAEAVYRSVE